jgi:WD40 repeat protein
VCGAFHKRLPCNRAGAAPRELYPYVERLDETIAILDIHRGSEFTFVERQVEQRNGPSVRALTFSDDGTLLVAAGYCGVTVRDMASRAIVPAIAGLHQRREPVTAITVSPDGDAIAFAMQNGALLLSATYGDRKPCALVAAGIDVDTIGFPDPVTVAVTFADGSLRRWNALSGRELSSGVPR